MGRATAKLTPLDRGAASCKAFLMQQILIIGAGLIGAALAYRLSQAGAGVTVVEAQAQPAAQASGHSFGWINASYYLTAAHHHLRVAGMAAHRRLAQDLGADLWDWQGCLWVEGAATLDQMATDLAEFGYDYQDLTHDRVAALAPALAHPPPRALYFPQEGAVDPAALTRALLTNAMKAGAKVLFNTPVLGLIQRGNGVSGVRLAAQEIAADQVIVAAGTGAAALLAGMGLHLPMLRRPGVILATQPVPQRLAPILALNGQEVRQDRQGRFWMPVAPHHPSDATETLTADPQASVDAAMAALNALFQGPPILRAAHWAAAYRPVPGDGLPAIGPVAPGLWLAVLHSGVTLGPLVADLLTADVLGAPAAPDLSPFRPTRFWS